METNRNDMAGSNALTRHSVYDSGKDRSAELSASFDFAWHFFRIPSDSSLRYS